MKSKYKFTREEHELVLNLFILKRRYESYFNYMDFIDYERLVTGKDFLLDADAFPMDEYAYLTVTATNEQISVSFDLKHNCIQEV